MDDSAPDSSPRLPELTEALLDEATVDQLFADLAACTQVFEINAKWAAQSMTGPPAGLDLAEARELLRQGKVRGVQVRYRYQDAEWCDTLLVTPRGIRVVRIRPEVA